LTLVYTDPAHHPALHSFPTRRSSDLLPDDEQREKASVRLIAEMQQRAGDNAERDRAQPIGMLAKIGAHERDGNDGAEASRQPRQDRKSTRLNSSHSQISYAVFCLKKK